MASTRALEIINYLLQKCSTKCHKQSNNLCNLCSNATIKIKSTSSHAYRSMLSHPIPHQPPNTTKTKKDTNKYIESKPKYRIRDKSYVFFSKQEVDRICDEVKHTNDMIESSSSSTTEFVERKCNLVHIKDNQFRAPCSIQNKKHNPWEETINWKQVVII